METNEFSPADLLYGEGTSPLCLSIIRKRFDLAKKLIELGADVNYVEYSGGTAMRNAALCSPPDSVELINLLAKAGADINALNDEWESPLHGAVQFNLPQNVEALLQHGANVDAMSKYFTPLHLALFMDNGDQTENINILLRYNADTYIINKALKRPHHSYRGKDALQIEDRSYSGKDALQMAEVAGSIGSKPYHKAYAGIIRHHREQG